MACSLGPYGLYANIEVCDSNCGMCPPLFQGLWYLHRGTNTPVKVTPTFQAFQFTSGSVDVDGFQWYRSTVFTDDGDPVIQVGVKDTKTPDDRTIQIKVLGEMTGGGMLGTFTTLQPHTIAQWNVNDPEYNSCFTFDAIDLAKVCAFGRCVRFRDTNYVGSLVLQRTSVCGETQMHGSSGSTPYGHIENYNCIDLIE